MKLREVMVHDAELAMEALVIERRRRVFLPGKTERGTVRILGSSVGSWWATEREVNPLEVGHIVVVRTKERGRKWKGWEGLMIALKLRTYNARARPRLVPGMTAERSVLD